MVVAGATGAISEVYSDLQRAAGATERLVELLESPVMISSPAKPRALSGHHVELEFKKVSFAYETRPEIQVLSEIDFLVGSGEMVAIVGPSGAGKSTIFDLTQRFYDPTSGSITINGSQIKDFSLQEIRDKMGYVSQDPVLFSGSLKSNLLYVNRRVSEEDIREALELAKVDFVDELPNGLDTLVGEDGVGLSGGQRQRIAIARALYKKADLVEAIKALDQLIQLEPKNPYFWELKGQVLLESNKRGMACDAFEKAYLYSGNPIILRQLAKAELLLDTPNSNSSALKHLEEAIRMTPDSPPTWKQLAVAQGRNGKIALAQLSLAEEALLRKNFTRALKNALYAKKNLKRDIFAYQRALDIINYVKQARNFK